jgi:tRNA(Ile)-lysidine synthase
LRYAAEKLGAAADFPATEALRALALAGRAGQKRELAQGLRAERTSRELRLEVLPVVPIGVAASAAAPEYTVAVPGEVTAPAFGLRLSIETDSSASRQTAGKLEAVNGNTISCQADTPSRIAEIQAENSTGDAVAEEFQPVAESEILSASVAPAIPAHLPGSAATLRNWRPGDRVRLRFSASPHKVKEVLERLRVTGSSRALWPVLEFEGRIVWMQGVEVEPVPGVRITAASL